MALTGDVEPEAEGTAQLLTASTEEVEPSTEEAQLSPFAFHSSLTDGLGVGEDSSDVHYFVVDSG
eukprot:1653352-Rhodomonas_salina.1